MQKTIATLALFLLTFCGLAAEAPSANDEINLQGTWIVVSASEDGRLLTDGVFDQIVISGDQLTMSDKTGKQKKGFFRLDPTQTPKALIFPADNPPNVIPAHFAYELDGDSLKIVNSAPNRKPAEINDKGQLLVTLKRKKS